MGDGEDFVANVKNERVRLRHSFSTAKRNRRPTEDHNTVGARALKKVTRRAAFECKVR